MDWNSTSISSVLNKSSICGGVFSSLFSRGVSLEQLASSSEVCFIHVSLNLFANRFLVELNQMLGSVALLSDVVVTTTPLTNLRVVMVEMFLGSALALVRIIVFLMMLIFCCLTFP